MKIIIDSLRNRFPRLYQWFKPVRIQKYYFTLRFRPQSQVFEQIYRESGWGSTESVSGAGSELSNTRIIREKIPSLLKRYGCASLLDVPCGDFNWMRTLELDLNYIGGDIVPDLIEANRRRYGMNNRQFMVINLVSDSLPLADIILCRDCLVHLSNSDALKALRRIKDSGAQYLLATTFPNLVFNPNIPTGAWRAINLTKPPFRFPEPLEMIH